MVRELAALYVPILIFIVFATAIYVALKDFLGNSLAKSLLRVSFIITIIITLSAPIFVYSFFRNRYPQYFTPEYRQAMRNWGQAITLVEENRDLPQAEQYLLEALQLGPKDIQAYEWLIRCYLKMQDFPRAEQYLISLLEINPHNVWALQTQHRLMTGQE